MDLKLSRSYDCFPVSKQHRVIQHALAKGQSLIEFNTKEESAIIFHEIANFYQAVVDYSFTPQFIIEILSLKLIVSNLVFPIQQPEAFVKPKFCFCIRIEEA